MHPRAPLEILLVEDDSGHATLLERTLRRGGVTNVVTRFMDGEDVLVFLRETLAGGEPKQPYLLLLDLRLPRMGGLEVLRELRADVQLEHLPALVLSTTESAESMREAQTLGCPALLTKPLRFADFLQAVEGLGLRSGLEGSIEDA